MAGKTSLLQIRIAAHPPGVDFTSEHDKLSLFAFAIETDSDTSTELPFL